MWEHSLHLNVKFIRSLKIYLENVMDKINYLLLCIEMCISPTAGSDGKEFACNAGSEKAMAPHSSTLAWRIPGTGEPGGLPSMGSHRVGHD